MAPAVLRRGRVTLPAPLRPVKDYLGTPRGRRLDARFVRVIGHSPYSYLYGLDLGTAGRSYRPPLALTTIGRRSGRLHTVALAYYEVDGAWAVVGSAGGSETEPQWVTNLRADPVAWVHLHRRSTPVLGEVLDGEAKRPIWDTITARVPLFGSFQEGVSRGIPIVVLRPRA
jgi:deazaflavin-dependent oxidoreductase (nitroreductase family)